MDQKSAGHFSMGRPLADKRVWPETRLSWDRQLAGLFWVMCDW